MKRWSSVATWSWWAVVRAVMFISPGERCNTDAG
jgi:hypothetical protein